MGTGHNTCHKRFTQKSQSFQCAGCFPTVVSVGEVQSKGGYEDLETYITVDAGTNTCTCKLSFTYLDMCLSTRPISITAAVFQYYTNI